MLFNRDNTHDALPANVPVYPGDTVLIQREVWNNDTRTYDLVWAEGQLVKVGLSPYYAEENQLIERYYVRSLPNTPAWSDYVLAVYLPEAEFARRAYAVAVA